MIFLEPVIAALLGAGVTALAVFFRKNIAAQAVLKYGPLIKKAYDIIDPILDKISPDAMLILGDTNSCLSAIAAKKKKIPVFHYEAGNRCFDYRVPEETNRRLVDHISDINLTYSSNASTNLSREIWHLHLFTK